MIPATSPPNIDLSQKRLFTRTIQSNLEKVYDTLSSAILSLSLSLPLALGYEKREAYEEEVA